MPRLRLDLNGHSPRVKPVESSTQSFAHPPTRPPVGKLPKSPLANCFRHILNPDTGEPEWRYYLLWVEIAANEGDEKMKVLLDHYLSLPTREQATVMPEQLCDMANVPPHELMGVVAGQLFKYGRQETLMIAAIQQPQIVAAVAERAKQYEGAPDATLFLKGTGFVPTPKGTTFLVNRQLEAHEPIPIGSGSVAQLGRPQGLVPAAKRVLDLEALEETEVVAVAGASEDTDEDED